MEQITVIEIDIQNSVAVLDVCIKYKLNKIIELHNQWNFESITIVVNILMK